MAKPILVVSTSGHIADGSVAHNATIDCTGANMLVVTVKHTGTTGLRHDAPTIDGTAMTLLGGSHPTNTHTRVWYLLNPSQSSVTVVIPAYQSIINKGFILEAFSGVNTAAPLRELAAITADNPLGALLATAAARDTTSFPITVPAVPASGLIATQAYLGHTSTRTWATDANTPIHQQRINSYPFAAATNEQGAGADVTIPWSFETVHVSGDANTVAFVLNGTAAPADPTLSGRLARRNGSVAASATNITLTASTGPGVASVLPANTTIATDASGNWSISDATNLAYATKYWVTLSDANGDNTWAGYITTPAEVV